MLLAGDIGGTKTRLAAFTTSGGGLQLAVEQTFPSSNYAGLDVIAQEFVGQHGLTVDQAGFGVAGPVMYGRATITNLPWLIDAGQLATCLGIPSVTLINDLEATAWGIAALEPSDFLVLNPGVPDATGNAAVIAAGTGLGEAGLYWDGTEHRPFASEGGHAGFAPCTPLEVELLHYLMTHFAHVSCERVLSGPGLVNTYTFLRDTGRGAETADLGDAMRQGDPAAAITQAALAGTSPLCEAALDLFIAIYGSAAGNLALLLMASGGIYVGGGIAPRIATRLSEGTFMRAFVAKGRMQSLLQTIPVRVVLNDGAALLGAARAALPRATRGIMEAA